jgi:SAM-dependent methyltransferase
MDGLRLIRLSMRRPDLRLTGLDIDAELIELARAHAGGAGIGIQFILGDITAPPPLERFDYAMCLNNTLGYIPEDGLAVARMRQVAGSVLVSVYGERTTDGLAGEYFGVLGTAVTGVRHLGDCDLIIVEGLGEVRRYHAERLETWTTEKQDTPLGYWARIAGTP